ncbi:hypothetical protein ACFL2E_08640, partial [Thermodesulfobacteriota bacterium]
MIGKFAVAWIRGHLSVVDPAGLVGMFGFYYFFLSPLIFVWSNYSLPYALDNPADYRLYVGILSSLNFIGLLSFSFIINVFGSKKIIFKKIIVPHKNSKMIYSLALVICSLSLFYCISVYGGIKALFLSQFQNSYIS